MPPDVEGHPPTIRAELQSIHLLVAFQQGEAFSSRDVKPVEAAVVLFGDDDRVSVTSPLVNLAVAANLTWGATHRLHHQYSDQPEDPHSPRVSGFWAHLGWIIFGEAQHSDTARLARYAPDLNKDPFYRWLSSYHWVPLTVLGFGLLAWGGWGMVNWAIFLRVTVGLHATWMINSATHMFGKRRFDTDDDSRNVWWVALITFGEGWHNNHHAHPVSAKHGLAWYEFDWTWASLRILKAFGVVWDLKVARVKQSLEEAAA